MTRQFRIMPNGIPIVEASPVSKAEKEHILLQLALKENKQLKEDNDKYLEDMCTSAAQVYFMSQQITRLKLQIENLKKLLPKKEKLEPLPLNLTDIFDDIFHVNS